MLHTKTEKNDQFNYPTQCFLQLILILQLMIV